MHEVIYNGLDVANIIKQRNTTTTTKKHSAVLHKFFLTNFKWCTFTQMMYKPNDGKNKEGYGSRIF